MKKLEVKLSDECMAKLDDLVLEARRSGILGDFASRSEIIRLLIEKEWLQQASPNRT